MTAQISKSEQDERGLLPYPVIIAATASSFAVISLPPTTKDCSASSSAKYLSQT